MAVFVSFLADPILLASFGVLLGLAVYLYRKRWGVIIILLAIFQLWLFAIPSFAGFMTYKLEQNVYQYSTNPGKYTLDNKPIDYIVIMGGSHTTFSRTSSFDRFGSDSIRRILEGLAIAKQHEDAKFIVGGNNGHPYLTVSLLIDIGINEDRIIKNRHVLNTQYEIKRIADLMDQGVVSRGGNIIIVSTANHIPRVRVWAKHYGLSPLYSGVGYRGFVGVENKSLYSILLSLIPTTKHQALSDSMLHEYLGIVYAHYFIFTDRWLR